MKDSAVSCNGRRKSLIALFFVAALAWPGLAAAADKRVGIPRFEGQQEALIRKVVMQVVKSKGFELVRSREVDDGVKSSGASLDSDDGFQKLAKELALSAIVTGEVGKKKAKLTVRNGADGSVADEATFAGATPRKVAVDVAKTFWKRLGSAIGRGKVPAGAKKPSKSGAAAAPEDNEDDKEAAAAVADKESDKGEKDDKEKEKDKADEKPSRSDEKPSAAAAEEEKPKKKRKPAAEEAASSAEGGPGLRYLDLAIGARGFNRNLSFKDNYSSIRPYTLTAPALGLAAVWYPAAMGGSTGPLANIGIDANAELAFGLTSKTKTDNVSYPTSVHDYAIGLRYRIPLSGNELDVSGTGGEHAFKLTSGTGPDAVRSNLLLPDTIYRYVRLGALFRAPVGPVSVYVGAAYRYILKPGQIKDVYFKNLSVGGIDAAAGVGYALTQMIELRAGIDVRRYFYNFKVQQGDPYLVGGAIDQYITGTFMVAITLDGGDKH